MEENNSELLLPRNYLSWSAMEYWEKNKERFRREYFENGKRLDTKYLRFGKKIATLVEDLCKLQESDKLSKEDALEIIAMQNNLDEVTKNTLAELDTSGESEYEIRELINGVPILSFLDKYVHEDNIIREYKTGKNAWTQAKVQKHGQLVFYATGLYKRFGEMPPYADLVWLETVDGGEPENFSPFSNNNEINIKLTGKLQSYRRYFDIREIEKMEERILKNAREISAAYQLFIEEI